MAKRGQKTDVVGFAEKYEKTRSLVLLEIELSRFVVPFTLFLAVLSVISQPVWHIQAALARDILHGQQKPLKGAKSAHSRS